MRPAPFLLAAAILVVSSFGALAQGPLDEVDDLFVLRGSQIPDGLTTADGEEETDATSSRVVRQEPVETADPLDDTTTASLRRTTAPDSDPYAALGIRAGGFILYPSLTVTTGYTSNAAGAAGGSGSAYATLAKEVDVRSDWAENEATLALRGSYETFFDGTTPGQPTAAVEATGRIDGDDDWSVALAGGYTFETQAVSDPDFPAGVDRPPGVHGLAASAALNGDGRTVVQLQGKIDRTIYENGTSGGSVVDQSDRTNTVVAGRLRLGYQVSESLAPFVEGELSRSIYDRAVDNDGRMRSGFARAFRAGVMLDRAPVLTGEIAVGYLSADFDDPALAQLAAFIVDGSLVWSPSELTTVTFSAATSLNASTDPASSGSVVHNGSVDLAYAWRRNVTFDGTVAVRHERFQGTEQIDTKYRAGVAATWKANRWLHLTSGYEHEWLVSTVAGRGYQSDAVRIELRAQR